MASKKTVKKISPLKVDVPLTVPPQFHKTYVENYQDATQNTGQLFLFAADQKIEHLNQDFYGTDISKDAETPTHLFEIASNARIGAFATQLGLVARYAQNYKNSKINYIIKLNAKTNLISSTQADPLSTMLHDIGQVVELKQNSELNIVGVGYTLYLGSEHESLMLEQAAQAVYQAHQHGLLAILWIYPRGKAVQNERSAEIVAGAAGVATALGADFVKIIPPEASTSSQSAKLLNQAVLAAGNTKVVCAGGQKKDPQMFLKEIHELIHLGNVGGVAVGRNIFQRNLREAVKLCNQIAAIVFDKLDLKTAHKI